MMPINDYFQAKNNFDKYSTVESSLVYAGNVNTCTDEGENDLCIVIPTFRRIDGVKRALNSIFNQESGLIKFNVIVLDNDNFVFQGSDMERMLNEYPNKPLLYYQNERNIGMFGNFNRCIELSDAEWVSMLHDDDYLCDDYFAKIGKVLARLRKDKMAAYVKVHMISEKNMSKLYGGKLYEKLRQLCGKRIIRFTSKDYDILGSGWVGALGAPSGGTLINKDKFMETGGYDETHYPSADAYLPEAMVTRYKYHVYYTIGTFGVYCRDNNTSLKPETIVGFMKEKISYLDYFANRNTLSGVLTNWFRNEIICLGKDNCKPMIESGQLYNGERLTDVLDDLTKSFKRNTFKCRVYEIFQTLYYRASTFIKILFTK